MTPADILDVARDGILTVILVSAPLMVVGLVIGVAVSLVQALTQIQEQTLVFVPKILAIFATMLVALPFMGDLMSGIMGRIMSRWFSAGESGLIRPRRTQFQEGAPPMNLPLSPELMVVFLLVFARVGTMMALMPGLGERAMPMRVRLGIALLLTMILFPLHRPLYAIDLTRPAGVFLMLFMEMAVGFTLGMAGRIAVSALQTAGVVIANAMGLGFAMQVDPTQGQQGAVIGTFLTLTGIAIIFASDLHHLVIAAISDSFSIIRPGALPASGDAAQFLVGVMSKAFLVAIQLSAPFLVFALVFNIGLGILSKLMPQMQVFFVAMPVTIGVGFLILLLVIGVMMAHYAGHLEALLGEIAVNRR